MTKQIVKHVLSSFEYYDELEASRDALSNRMSWSWPCSQEKNEFLKKHNIGISQHKEYVMEERRFLYKTVGYFPEELLTYWILRFE